MKLSDRLARSKDYATNLQKIKMETANEAIRSFMQTDQYKLAVEAMPNSDIAIDSIVNTAVRSITDPIADFQDTLRAKGFRGGEIRSIAHRLYNTYCTDLSENPEEFVYDKHVLAVATYVMAHQEIYATLNPEEMRGGN